LTETARKARTKGQVWEVVNRERKRRRVLYYFKRVLGGIKGGW